MTIDYGGFDVLTFDCYGTLIDWETGLLAALREALPGLDVADEQLLEEYAALEADAEAGPYLPYREVLARGVRGIAAQYGLSLADDAVAPVRGERARLARLSRLGRGARAAQASASGSA